LKSSADTWSNELQILRNVRHVSSRCSLSLLDLNFWQPSIIRLIHHNAATLTLELEHVGPDLARFVDGQRMSHLSDDQQHRIWIDISHGIKYIHAESIIHFDIKPENILLGAGNRAVLCDFGISMKGATSPVFHDGGTPCYIPPEYVFHVQRGYPGDIWAFGVTLLFVFGIISLPLGTWMIADVPKNPHVRSKMLDWLDDLEQIVESAPGRLSLLRSMLINNPKKRITALQLVDKLPATVLSERMYTDVLVQTVS